MTKITLPILTVLTALILVTLLLMNRAQTPRHTITTHASAATDVTPDMADIAIAIETKAPTVQTASAENRKLSDKVYASIKNLLTKKEELKTTQFQVSPIYTYDSQTKPPQNNLTGYRATNEIQVSVHDIQKIATIIQSALDNGANRISNLSYSVSDPEALCQPLLQQAVEKARTQAETLAKTLDEKIIGVDNVATNCNAYHPPYRLAGLVMLAKSNQAEASPPPLSAGKTKQSANVDVTFLLERKGIRAFFE